MTSAKGKYCSNKPYQSALTRRDALKWLGALSISAAFPALTACSSKSTVAETQIAATKGHWPQLNLSPINATGYGKDPDLILAPKSAWPRTLISAQLTLLAVLSDIMVPREGNVPSASEVKVPDVVDEWVSAPYERQQEDRAAILPLLTWLDDESRQRFDGLFVDISSANQRTIIDDIAYTKADIIEEFARPTQAFSRLRRLILACFFCSPEGVKDMGYLGNVPIAGDYPGPTDEAMVHLNKVLDELGLSL
ncbi:gluconate 2-dehydrogenase subunit 3 family protein [Shewanella sp. D64]|uniref:gluconate 2-dehydrogenase subunit 3 family protein n=1 Tax=unclassified Shewanella TaxID=196818 RepID=UPI0022BA2A68|nr:MULTISPECIES: gluconate 2-dehydrogenase subunit 3 family protein [unclassified Shewanella]MEC4725486.1 gluconate 2-dehydrogenase subunit 3 family protein [Shewanella sp. D64]MEC4738695.1 gluconate 2-dehydrogenase subunit 3 family protein [Shewanella sp. E94]WBJ94991.1 gluconate 2-dehydrogenase subunit 3 family protein [Shewanella sp. MTB7]